MGEILELATVRYMPDTTKPPMRSYPRQLPRATWNRMTSFQRLAEGRRRELGIKWIELAELTEIRRPTLHALLLDADRGAPRHDQLLALSKALDLPLIELQAAVADDYGWDAVEVEHGPLKLLIFHAKDMDEERIRILTEHARLLLQEPRPELGRQSS
jgi:hypothetical protein